MWTEKDGYFSCMKENNRQERKKTGIKTPCSAQKEEICEIMIGKQMYKKSSAETIGGELQFYMLLMYFSSLIKLVLFWSFFSVLRLYNLYMPYTQVEPRIRSFASFLLTLCMHKRS